MSSPFLNIHTHQESFHGDPAKKHAPANPVREIYNLRPREMVDSKPDSFRGAALSAGIHPWYLLESTLPFQLQQVEALASRSEIKLIGECGLDALRGPSLEIQETAFVEQIDMARRHQKPLLIHCVRAYDELIRISREQTIQVPAIIHGFNKSPQLAESLMKHGFLLSFGEALFQSSSHASKALIQTYQSGQEFFLETDGSGLSITAIYQQASYLLKISTDQLKDAIFANWKKICLTHD